MLLLALNESHEYGRSSSLGVYRVRDSRSSVVQLPSCTLLLYTEVLK